MEHSAEITKLLQEFQDGYTLRDTTKIDEFMHLFREDAEIIGTNGIRPGVDEWYTDRISARELVLGDWESWGDLKLDLSQASVKAVGTVGWVACPATVTQRIGKENYEHYLEFIQDYIKTSPLSAEEKLRFILRGGTNTVYEISRGDNFVWALRLTATVVYDTNCWKFAQIHFSFPTIYFPDVRIF